MRKSFSLLYFFAVVALSLTITLALNPVAVYAQVKKVLVDLNNASEKELEALKGVGPATAKKIIENRPYKSVDELSKAGVPAKTIQDLKPFVTVGPAAAPAKKVERAPAKAAEPPEKAAKPAKEKPVPAEKPRAPGAEKAKKAEKPAAKLAPGQKVNINTATKEELEALPEIGPAKAQAIIEGRPYQKPEDIMKVKGIKEGTYNKIKDLITVK